MSKPTVHHFSSSVAKIDKDGNTVLSNYIVAGEKLTNGVTFEEVLDGTLVKNAEVEHQDNTTALTTEETVTNTVAEEVKPAAKKRSKKEPEAQAPSSTTDEAVGQGDTGVTKEA